MIKKKKLLSCSIWIVCSNGVGEFDDKIFCSFLESQNIRHKISSPYTFAQNRKSLK